MRLQGEDSWARKNAPIHFLGTVGKTHGKASILKDLRDPKVWDSSEWNEWDWVATDQKLFRLAFEALVEAGCDKRVLLDLLERIQVLEIEWDSRASPDDIRGIREGLEQGRLALRGLVEGLSAGDLLGPGEAPAKVVREEWRLLRFSRDEADVALRILRDLSNQLKKLQRGADRRRSRLQDQYRAILVRYVKRKTGKVHDRLVCDLLDGAIAPLPEYHHLFADKFDPDIDESWEPVTVASVNTSKAAIDRHFKTGHHTCGERDGLRSTAGSPGASSAHVDHGFPGRGYPTRIVVCVHVGDDGLWSLWAARAPSKAVWKTRSPPPQLVPGVRPRFPYRWRDPEALGSHSTDEDAARAPPAPAPAL